MFVFLHFFTPLYFYTLVCIILYNETKMAFEEREIKFRAWDKKKKFMVEPFRLQNLSFKFVSSKNHIFLQFIGLKDKNGKEIYEGDILQNSTIGKCVVRFGCFKLGENDWGVEYKTMGFSGEWRDCSTSDTGLENKKELEVIGNIFENPELVNKQ